MSVLGQPAFWASIGALLGAIGLEMIPAQQIGEHVIAAVAAVSGIIGIINTLWNAGHRVRYEHAQPDAQKK